MLGKLCVPIDALVECFSCKSRCVNWGNADYNNCKMGAKAVAKCVEWNRKNPKYYPYPASLDEILAAMVQANPDFYLAHSIEPVSREAR